MCTNNNEYMYGWAAEVFSWFRAVDQDNSGFINAQELSKALQSGNNRNFSVQACSIMMGMFDHSRTGRIDVNQFGQLFAYINQWTEAFRRADSDNSGSITVNEMMPGEYCASNQHMFMTNISYGCYVHVYW